MKKLIVFGLFASGCSYFPIGHDKSAEPITSSEPVTYSSPYDANDLERQAQAESQAKESENPEAHKNREEIEFKTNYPITFEMSQTEYLTKFFKNTCGADFKKISHWSKKQVHNCNEVYRKAFLAKLELNYKRADWHKMGTWCRAEPVACSNDMKQVEAEARESDNEISANIAAENNARRDAANEQQRQNDEQYDEQIRLQKLQLLMQMQHKQTNCRSVPTFGGGFTTQCY